MYGTGSTIAFQNSTLKISEVINFQFLLTWQLRTKFVVNVHEDYFKLATLNFKNIIY